MTSKAFDIRLIPEFSGAVTDMPVVGWLEHVEKVCELCAMDRVEHVLRLQLRGGALAVYQQLSQEQRMDPEEIKRALMTTYAMDAFNTFDEFTALQLRQNKTVDKFLADFHHLTQLLRETDARTLYDIHVCIRTTATCQTTSPGIIQGGDHDPGAASDPGSRRHD